MALVGAAEKPVQQQAPLECGVNYQHMIKGAEQEWMLFVLPGRDGGLFLDQGSFPECHLAARSHMTHMKRGGWRSNWCLRLLDWSIAELPGSLPFVMSQRALLLDLYLYSCWWDFLCCLLLQ